jgi:hypothetical protein
VTSPNLLRIIREAPPAVVLKVEALLELLQPERSGTFDHPGLNVFLLRLAEYAPTAWTMALDALAEQRCVACGHGLHVRGDCLIAGVDGAGGETYCLCGAPGAPVVALFTDEVAQVQRELADRAWEHHQDAVRDAAAEADR